MGQSSPELASLRGPAPADADPTAAQPGQATPAGSAVTKPPAGSVEAGQAVTELRSNHGKDAPSVVLNSAGTIKSVTAAPGKTLAAQRDAFTTRYAAGFGASSTSKLQAEAPSKLPGGDAVTRYQQVVGGLPVMGGELLVTTNSKGAVRGALSALDGSTPKTVSARITADAARAAAIKAFGDRYATGADQIAQATAKLWLADPAKFGQPGSGLSPVYWVKLTGADGGELGDVIVDALTGKVGLAASDRQTARSRRVCDLANGRVNLDFAYNYSCAVGTTLGSKSTSRAEGKPASSVAEVNAAYDHLGAVYDFYKNTFGLDSFDGSGSEVRATVRTCDLTPSPCPYPNAFWEGSQFVFGAGFAVDDVVAHEFTHAVTEYSSGLYYWYEPGAINEAFSDIMGQFVDLRTPNDDQGTNRWLLGEALNGPTQYGAIRSMANPNTFGDPARYNDPLWYTDTLGAERDNGGVHYNSGVANKLASLLADGGTFNGVKVRGIGLGRSEQLWYRVMHLVSSGADYRELRLALGSACQQLIGSYYIRAEHCDSVQQAITAVALPVTSANERTVTADYCPGSPYQAPATVYLNQFESGMSGWTTDQPARWQVAPSLDVPYTYAASGQGSLNGWTSQSGLGSGTSAEMISAVTLPAGTPYLSYATSVFLNSGAQGKVYIQGTNGTWNPVQTITTPTRGYTVNRVDLTAYAGQAVKVRFRIENAAGIDWYVDDVQLYSCTGRPSAPTKPVAYYDGTSIRACWGLPQYTGTAPSTWDVQVTPGGTPERSTYNDREQLQIKNVTQGTTYTITVRYVSNGQLGEPLTLEVNAAAGSYVPPFTVGSGRPAPGPQPVCGGERTVARR
ncbi:M4 family metallopeptidase [Allocatelliglobosispora scoriae]|uniref:M4 family metallopeptidase n=1 Tax=Allocatelliglobosispora scoriae TaxID=643052 RepID=UPI00160AC9D7|nr:M4 family metallopeptidase [Allocatelliglobosispora scoriae]